MERGTGASHSPVRSPATPRGSIAPSRRCPRCGSAKSWRLKTGWRRCARCRFDWQPGRWPLRLSAAEWRRVLQWFVRDVPSAVVARETRLERKRVLRALTVVRQRIAWTPPPPIRHVRDVAGRRAHDLPGPVLDARADQARPTRRSTVIGIYVEHGVVWAETASPHDAQTVRAWLHQPRAHDATPEALASAYAAVVLRGRLRRVPAESAQNGSPPAIGVVEGFWAFVQRRLKARGGIRLSRLDLYLAECAWRYNRRRVSAADQLRELTELVHHGPRKWDKRDYH